jgi:hypothetical protein
VTFESIPAGVKRITVNLAGISTNGTSLKLIQIGDSGGYEDADYTSKAAQMGTSVATATSTAGFVIANDGAAASVLHGSITLSLVEASSNTWAASGNLSRSDTTAMQVCAGSKALSGTLDRIQLTTVNGTDEFDAGSINILYEL